MTVTIRTKMTATLGHGQISSAVPVGERFVYASTATPRLWGCWRGAYVLSEPYSPES
jgi:hypothetical protein